MAKRKKAVKKKAYKAPRKVTVTVTKQTKIGKVSRPARGSAFYIKAAKDKLYSELGTQMVKKEKAAKKSIKKKIGKKITEIKRKINKLK